MLSGPRQVGKTTLLLQCIQRLLKKGVPPQNILYVTFDHPLFKLMGVERVLQMWRDVEVRVSGDEYIFVDEVQFLRDWQTWLKLQVDFQKDRRLIVTGSATPLLTEGQESGVGRWHTIRLPTLSFYEYLKIKDVALPSVPEVTSLARLFAWDKRDFASVSDVARPLAAQFHEYLLRGGFPQCALTDSIELAQRLLREDIVDKVLKRDMTALFGVRRILELEQTFLYLCLHDGGLLDITTLSKNLAVKKQTAANFISLLENTHLIYRLSPFGYGKFARRRRGAGARRGNRLFQACLYPVL
jgi:predicted AAA+ superfamily ATPase